MPIRGPVPAKLYKKEAAETLRVGPMTIRVYEDGSLTENRVSAVLLTVPAGKSGPPMHWHRFHDELFFVTKGTPLGADRVDRPRLVVVLSRAWLTRTTGSLTFVTPNGEVTASEGDLMSVPPGAIHTFKNASETEDCECYMTATPGHYVDCEFYIAVPKKGCQC